VVERCVRRALRRARRRRRRARGPPGALYAGNFFEDEVGDVTAFVPVAAAAGPRGPRRTEIAGGEFAVAVHAGSFADLDRAYAALGTVVAERAIGLDAPIREHYLVSPLETADESRHRTEVCWPVFHAGARPPSPG
jgi:effector-binding domain-containing protein